MAVTRFYLTTTEPAPAAWVPAFDASWEQTTSVLRARMSTFKRKGAMTSLAIAETSASGTFDFLFRQYFSDQLAAQTISGNISGIIRALESAADADFRAQMVVRVVSEDGGTVRGTLLASDAGALSNEFDATTLTNRKFPLNGNGALTNVAAQLGDRLLVEIGIRAHNVTATSKTGTLRFGDASASDLANNETGTTDDNPWIEFDSTITFAEVTTEDRRHEQAHATQSNYTTIGYPTYEPPQHMDGPDLSKGTFKSVELGATSQVNIASNDVPPVIDNFSPAVASTILRTDHIAFNITDDIDELARVVIMAEFSSGKSEVVWDGSAFVAPYASATRTPIALGYSFDLVRTAPGWLAAGLTLRVIAHDDDGNEATPVTYAFTVSNPATGPVVDTFSPADASSIVRTAAAAFHVTDDGGTPARVIVTVTFADGTVEVVHDGSAFVGAYTGSTRSGIANGYSFSLLHSSPGWPSATLMFSVTALDADSNFTIDSSYNLTVSNPSGATPPVIDTFSPANASTILVTDTASFHVTDETALSDVIVEVLHSNGLLEIIHDGGAFKAPYSASSTRSGISGGYAFVITRTGGWPSASFTITVRATDSDGNVTSTPTYTLNVSNPPPGPDVTTPTVSNVSPTPGTPISRSQPLFLDVTDNTGFRRILLVAFFDPNDGGDGQREVVHDGDQFAARYIALSERTVISGGYRYRIRRASGGWPSAPTIIPYAIDTSGNEAV